MRLLLYAPKTSSATIATLLELPARGKVIADTGIRELIIPFGKAAYIVRYRYAEVEQEIVILRIWHSREQRT